MSETRYYAETPCEHGQMTQHALTRLKEDGSRWDKDAGRETWAWCPGGTRSEITIDYETAARVHSGMKDPGEDYIEYVIKPVVDAAIGVQCQYAAPFAGAEGGPPTPTYCRRCGRPKEDH